jgi:P27 family predicted phage terminase small subunit
MGAMARPAKSVKLRTGHVTKDEDRLRQETEDKLRGRDDRITAPSWLNEGQREIFDFVIAEMSESGILGNLDVYVLTQFAVATERMYSIEEQINEDEIRVCHKDLIFARNSYVKDFWRGANELSLSPQARAKIGTINLSKKEDEKDQLKNLLAGKG